MAKKVKGSFFTKLLIISAILLGTVLSYSYVIGNSIQPHLGVVEKIYVGIFSSAKTIGGENKITNTGYNLKSNINITQENKKVFSGNVKIDNAQIFSNSTGLEQNISADLIHLVVDNNGEKKEKILEKLDIISQNENIYISSKKGLQDIFEYMGEYINIPFNSIVKDISKINQKGSYAHINNAEIFHKQLPNLESEHIINQIITSLVTSNPNQYFQNNNLINLIKQQAYNDKWIEYVFVENKKISEKNKQYFIIDKNICKQISPFLKNITNSINTEIGKNNGCEYIINDITPFIALVSQIYKIGDIENGNYDFVISQGTNIDMRFTYANHILQTWNIFIQNPENTIKTSLVGDKFGIKESQATFNYVQENHKITGSIINGTGNINLAINEKNKKINGNIIFQNYLLVDLDVKGSGKILGRDMKLLAIGDYKALKIDYSEKQEDKIYKGFNLNNTENGYKVDYISPKINTNSLYSLGKFIGGFSEKSDEGDVIKEIKYVYDQGQIKGHYRTPEFEGNIEGEILSENTFQIQLGIQQKEDYIKMILEGNKKSNFEIEYSAEGMMNDEILFTLESLHVNKNNISNLTVNIDVPKEKIKIDIQTEIEKISGITQYKIPENIQKLDIQMNEVIVLPNIHQLQKIAGPELIFVGVTLGSIGFSTSYLESQGTTRKNMNDKIISEMEIISDAIQGKLENIEFDITSLIQESEKTDSSNTLRIGGDKISIGDKYKLGTINYEILGIISDKLNRSDYKIALLLHGEKVEYQILGYLDVAGSQLQVVTTGNYIPREFIRYDFDIITPEGIENDKKLKTIQIKIQQDHDLKIGDMTNLGRILDKIDENLIIENDIHSDISKIYLLGNDAPTLFIDKNNKTLENGQIIIKK